MALGTKLGIISSTSSNTTPSFNNIYSLAFDGVDDYVDTNISTLTGTDFSISYWFKTTATLTNYTFYVPFSAVSNQQFTGAYLYYHPTTKLTVRSKNSSGTLVKGTIDLSDGNWHNIVVTYDSTSYALKMYVDGSIDYDETIFSYAVFNQPLLLGGKSSSQNLIDCSIDEASLFNSVLTPANVTSIYNSGIPNDLTSLNPTAWYRNGDNGTWKSPQWLIPSNENKTKFSNYSFEYDGVDDYVDVGALSFLPSATNLTVSAWLKTSDITDNQVAFGDNSATPIFSFEYWGSNNRMYFEYGLALYCYLSLSSVVSNDVWHHLALVYDGSGIADTDKIKIYINGVDKSSSLTFVGTIPTTLNASIGNLWIGNGQNYNSPFLGNIDEFAIWNSSLTAGNITTIYNSGVPNDLSSLSPVGYWRSEQSNFTDNWLVDNSALSNYSTRSFVFDGVDDYISVSDNSIGKSSKY